MCCKCNKNGEKMDFSKIELFNGIGPASCRDMMVCFGAEFASYRAGQLICDFSDDRRRRVGVMRSGRATMTRTDINGNETLLEEIGEGDIFGEVLCFCGGTADYVKLTCDEDCEVVFLKYDQITKRCEKACEHHSRLVANLFELMAKKALALSERIQLLSRRTTREKLLYYFSLQCGTAGEFTLTMSHTRLAEYLCVDRSAMVREMKRLSDDGAVVFDGKKVRLPCSE